MELLAEPGISINQITKLCRVSEHTVRAVRDREAISIAERKQRLTSIYGNIAEIAAERMEELAGTASLRDAGITAGIATDKLLTLSSDPQANQQHLHVHLDKVDLVGQWAEMIRKLSSSALKAKDTTAKALPSGPDSEATPPSEPCVGRKGPRKRRVSFHGRFLGFGNFWLQNHASLRKAVRSVLVEIT